MSQTKPSAAPITAVVAEREFEFHPRDGGDTARVIVRIGQPMQGEVDWLAPWEIEGPAVGVIDRHVSRGVDALQALLEALCMVPVRLALLAIRNNGRLTYLGKDPQLMDALLPWIAAAEPRRIKRPPLSSLRFRPQRSRKSSRLR